MRGIRRRVAAVLAGVTLVAAITTLGVMAVAGGQARRGAMPTPVTVATTRSVAPATATTPSTTAPITTTTTTTTSTTVSARDLQLGAAGADVQQLQRQLTALGYWLGLVDGTFGEPTRHAVVAFQKMVGLERTGVVGAATRNALTSATRAAATSTTGRVIEIDLQRQVLLAVRDGRVEWVFDTSTGKIAGRTPRGHWLVQHEIDGYHRSRLGLLYRPKYFHGGVAIHGFTTVPPYPASHGCVRVTYAAMDELWSAQLAPVGTPVWVY